MLYLYKHYYIKLVSNGGDINKHGNILKHNKCLTGYVYLLSKRSPVYCLDFGINFVISINYYIRLAEKF